ncbi:hypothetical protein KCU93_g7760, partial [Aureobasidium melanogenum]
MEVSSKRCMTKVLHDVSTWEGEPDTPLDSISIWLTTVIENVVDQTFCNTVIVNDVRGSDAGICILPVVFERSIQTELDQQNSEGKYGLVSDAAQEGLETVWEIRFRKTINSVFEGIRSLYRVSALLRRPRNSSQYLRSSTSTAISPDALRVTLDYAHVSQKVRQWRHLTMQSRLGADEGHAVTEEDIQFKKDNEQQEIADIAFFCQRLAWANLCRREQFKYWIDHPDVPESQTTASDVGKAIQQKDRIMSAISASLSTVAKSAREDNPEVGQSRTEAESAVGQPSTAQVPDVPKFDAKERDLGVVLPHKAYREVLRGKQKEPQNVKEGEHQAFLLEQQQSTGKEIEEERTRFVMQESSPSSISQIGGLSGRSSLSSVPQRDYILDLANPERAASGGNDSERVQKHPATFQCT